MEVHAVRPHPDLAHGGDPHPLRPWEHPEIASSHRGQYLLGYVLSVVLMGVSLLLVVEHALSPWALLLAIAAIAAVTLVAQLRLLFHLDFSEHQRWNTATLLLNIPLLILSIGLTAWMFRTLYLRVMVPDMPMAGMSAPMTDGGVSHQGQAYTAPPNGSSMQ